MTRSTKFALNGLHGDRRRQHQCTRRTNAGSRQVPEFYQHFKSFLIDPAHSFHPSHIPRRLLPPWLTSCAGESAALARVPTPIPARSSRPAVSEFLILCPRHPLVRLIDDAIKDDCADTGFRWRCSLAIYYPTGAPSTAHTNRRT